MGKYKNILVNLIFCIQVLLTFLSFFGEQIKLPLWLQITGRLHPLVLHLPIGFAILFFILILLPKRSSLEHKTLDAIVRIILLLTSLLASVTALSGFLLSTQGDYGLDSLSTHKVSGIILSWLCYGLLLGYDSLHERKIVFWGVNAFTLFVLFFTGHTGATLTHGENFVLAPLSKDTKRLLMAENSSVYQLAVEPLLEKKCYSCHNPSKAKGGLVMTSVASFKKGGKHGKEWVEGKPSESRLIKVIHLPLTHDQHMPPDGKAQLTIDEATLLKLWIQSGANFDVKIAELKPKDSLKLMASAMMATHQNIEEKIYPFSPASESTVEKLNTPFRALSPLYQNSPALRADFFVREAFRVQALEELKEIQDQLVELNLSHMPLSDKDLVVVGRFRNLEKLNLNFTRVTSDLSPLLSLRHLHSLSLSGTAVNSPEVNKLLSLPELRELFVWNTPISYSYQLVLTNRHKNLTIVWNIFNDEKPVKLSPPSMTNDGVLKKNEPLTLKHVMPGVTIRYTLDGAMPDSVHGRIYEAPIPLTGPVNLKARAYKKGWLKSDTYEAICFKEGYKAEKIELFTKPDPQYPGEGAEGLADGRKGVVDLFKEPSWMGFKENSFVAGFDFGAGSPLIKNIVISYGRNTGAYIFPPAEVQVWAGNSKDHVILVKSIKIAQPTANESAKIDALVIPLADERKTYYKIFVMPLNKLPAWHSGKGQKGWFFVDEVFFN